MTARERLPNRRRNESFEFSHRGLGYTATAGFFENGRPGEVFLSAASYGIGTVVGDRYRRPMPVCLAIDRRSLVCGLGTAAIAGVPVLASAAPMSDDPVFQAMAALEQLKIHAEEPDAAHSVAEDAVIAAKRKNGVTLDGKEMGTHEQIDAHFRPAFGPGDEEQFNTMIERLQRLRPSHLSAAERAERDLARQAAHDELARQEAEIAEVEQRTGYREIEARKDAADDAVWDAEYDVMEAKPATSAGAITLLLFVANLMEGFFQGDDEHEHYVVAIRNAAYFFERSASA